MKDLVLIHLYFFINVKGSDTAMILGVNTNNDNDAASNYLAFNGGYTYNLKHPNEWNIVKDGKLAPKKYDPTCII